MSPIELLYSNYYRRIQLGKISVTMEVKRLKDQHVNNKNLNKRLKAMVIRTNKIKA